MALIIVGIVAVVAYWINTSGYKSTDDAFIDTRTVSISSQVGAAIVNVPVTDNQLVEPGTVLVRLDDRDYKAQVDQAAAQVDQAAANIANIDAQVATQQARIDQAEKQNSTGASGSRFRAATERTLHQPGQKRRGYRRGGPANSSGLLQAQATSPRPANAVATEKQLPVLKAQRGIAEAQLEQARATKEQADANLSRTLITAPVAGRVAGLSAARGNYAAIGQALMMFVPRNVWVTANFKETQH